MHEQAVAIHARVEKLATTDMKWMGVVADDGVVVTLYGTATVSGDS